MFRKQCPRCYGTCLVSEKVVSKTGYHLMKCPVCNGFGEIINWSWLFWLLPLSMTFWAVIIWIAQ